MNCQRNLNSILPTQLPHTFSYIVATFIQNHFESPNINLHESYFLGSYLQLHCLHYNYSVLFLEWLPFRIQGERDKNSTESFMSHMTLSTYHLHPKHERHLPFRPAAPIRFFQLHTQRKIRDGKGGANGFRKKKEIPKQSTRALPRKNDM
jgi:hypothetical protein